MSVEVVKTSERSFFTTVSLLDLSKISASVYVSCTTKTSGLEDPGRSLSWRARRIQRILKETILRDRQMPYFCIAERAEAKYDCQYYHSGVFFKRGAQTGRMHDVCQKEIAGDSIPVPSVESFSQRRCWRAH